MAAELIGCNFHKLSEHTVSVHENREPSRLAKSWLRHQDSNAVEFDMVNVGKNCCIPLAPSNPSCNRQSRYKLEARRDRTTVDQKANAIRITELRRRPTIGGLR